MLTKNCNFLLLLSMICFLSGCHGSDEPNTPEKYISINTQSSLSFAKTKKTETVDLRQRVKADQEQDLIIDHVDSLDDNCDISDINGLTFQIRTYDPAVCRFKYTIKSASPEYKGDASDISQVVVNDEPSQGEYLPPTSETLKPLEAKTFDSKNLLIDDDFEIDPDSIVLIGDTESGDIGSISDKSAKGFVYTAPDTQGIVRIFYTEINSVDNTVRPGIVYIAIGQNENHNPVGIDETLDDISLNDEPQLFDIKATDLDGDNVQVVFARAVLGNVDIMPDDELTLEYTPQLSGHEYINYVVSDHNGGYGFGMLKFNISTYINIVNGSAVFLAPFTMNDDNLNIYSSTYFENGEFGVMGVYPTFTVSLANAYCATFGARLANSTQLLDVWDNVLKKEPIFLSRYKWHSGQPYLTSDNIMVNLSNGSTVKQKDDSMSYFSCVKDYSIYEWSFERDSYVTDFGDDVNISIRAYDEVWGEYIIRPPETVNLNISSLQVFYDGEEVTDPTEYVKVETFQNHVRILSLKPELKDLHVRVGIDEPETEGSTMIIIGFSECPSDITPEEAQSKYCIRVLSPEKPRDPADKDLKLTLPIQTKLLALAGVDPNEMADFDDIGTSEASWKRIKWYMVSTEVREKWLKMVEPVCNMMNYTKIGGRSNWKPGASHQAKGLYGVFFLNETDRVDSVRWDTYLQDADNNHFGDIFYYASGYVPLNVNDKYVVNQAVADATHQDGVKFNSTASGSVLKYPACVSDGLIDN